MAGQPHVHKYYKSHIGWGKNRKVVYRCALPDCSHYVASNAVLLKYSLCWRCSKEFILPKAISLLTSKPWCPDCAKKRRKGPPILEFETKGKLVPVDEAQVRRDMDSFIDNLIGGVKK